MNTSQLSLENLLAMQKLLRANSPSVLEVRHVALEGITIQVSDGRTIGAKSRSTENKA